MQRKMKDGRWKMGEWEMEEVGERKRESGKKTKQRRS
jgi:hypothetical protein